MFSHVLNKLIFKWKDWCMNNEEQEWTMYLFLSAFWQNHSTNPILLLTLCRWKMEDYSPLPTTTVFDVHVPPFHISNYCYIETTTHLLNGIKKHITIVHRLAYKEIVTLKLNIALPHPLDKNNPFKSIHTFLLYQQWRFWI